MTTFHIYHLIDPISGQVRYIGRCTDPKARLRNHCNEAARRQTTDKHRWINALLQKNRMPLMVIVATSSDPDESRAIESREFNLHKAGLFNIHAPMKFPAVIAKKGNK